MSVALHFFTVLFFVSALMFFSVPASSHQKSHPSKPLDSELEILNTSDDVLILNADVLKHIDSTSKTLLDIIAPPNSFDDMALLKPKSLSFKSQISFYSEVSHDLGVCGGFAQIPAKDLGRIQRNLLRQRQTHITETVSPTAFQKSSDKHIENLVSKISSTRLGNDINFISSFPNRAARNSNNQEIESIRNYISQNLPPTLLKYSIQLVSHRRVPQKSIHIQIQGKNPDRHIVIGGHIDSINTSWGSSQIAPGADDNASGSSAVIQVLKAILKDNYQPQNTLNFFWYAGEEVGLIGSAEIARNFSAQKTNVIAALQLDMLGVPDSSKSIYLEQDFSSPKLNQLIKQVATNYLPDLKLKNTSCGYPCSDHSSWYQENYPVVFPTSGDIRSSGFNRRIHTARDTADTIDLEYASNVTKLSLAFILAADKEL